MLVILAVILGGFFYIAGQSISVKETTSTGQIPSISVSGEGKVMAAPDVAKLSFGASTGRVPTAEAALDTLAKDMNAVIAALKELGVDDKDIATQSLYLNPAYDWNDGTQIPRGFEASQQLTVTIRDLGSIGDALTAATRAGANQIGGVQMTIDNPEELRAQARAAAIENAKEKAEKLADELDVDLGDIVSFSEGYNGNQPPIMYDRAMGVGGASESLPVPSGEQELSVTVTIGFEIED